MKKNYKRKYLIDAPFQLKQVSVLIVANLLIVMLISALLSWFYLIAWDGNAAYNHNKMIPVYIVISALLVTLTTIFLSFRRSRNIAGMMKKLEMVLGDASRGIYPSRSLVFRKSDYFKQLADPLNDCLMQLRAGKNEVKKDILIDLQLIQNQIETDTFDEENIRKQLDDLIQRLQF